MLGSSIFLVGQHVHRLSTLELKLINLSREGNFEVLVVCGYDLNQLICFPDDRVKGTCSEGARSRLRTWAARR